MAITDTLKAAAQWALDYLKAGESWIASEVSIFSHGVVTQLKLEVPTIEQGVVAALEDLVSQIVMEVEKEFTSGDLKWSNALSRLVAIIEGAGVGGMQLLLSQSTKETLIQDGVAALKAGLLAAQIAAAL